MRDAGYRRHAGRRDVLFKGLNRPDDARPWLETARLLFPDDQEVQAKLAALQPKE